jgi:hypothetical protein
LFPAVVFAVIALVVEQARRGRRCRFAHRVAMACRQTVAAEDSSGLRTPILRARGNRAAAAACHARYQSSEDFTVLEILAHSVHFPIELVRLCVKQQFQLFREITITRSATDLRIVNAATPILAITISRRFLTATLFGARATTTKTGCSNFRRRSEFR